MYNQLETNNQKLIQLIQFWTPKLMSLNLNVISNNLNSQKRNINQIIGHMVDSVSNNTHRIIHLQYQKCPLEFPNYATNGNNDRWIEIQNYNDENWSDLVNLWKFGHLHFIHVSENINEKKLEEVWNAGNNQMISLENMVYDFYRHFKLHISEIEELL